MSRTEALHIFILVYIGIALPLFELLSHNAEFFLARRSTPIDLISLVAFLCILIPSALVLIWLAIARIAAKVAGSIQILIVAVLMLLILLPFCKRIVTLPDFFLFPFALILSVAVGLFYRRSSAARAFFTYLSPALLLVPGLFLMNASVVEIVRPEDEYLFVARPVNSRIPVFLVVFDELPLVSLLNEERQIDAIRYPNFARLANNATWFRNATSVADRTKTAVPPILTGIYPKSAIPTIENYPDNLFTLLGGSYQLNVIETLTRLCPNQISSENSRISYFYRMSSMFADLAVVYLHIVLPSHMTASLPAVTRTWGNFWIAGRQGNMVKKIISYHFNRAQSYLESLDAIQRGEKPILYYCHLNIPHSPFEYLPSGKRYNPQGFAARDMDGLKEGGVWDQEWHAALGYQRHLLQVGYADLLLGKLIDKLHMEDLYDRALIIVTADHGASFRVGQSLRGLGPSNYSDIISVPLLIKKPNQQTASISDRNVELIDILPTISEVLGLRLRWTVEGNSVFSALEQRKKKRVTLTNSQTLFEVPDDPEMKYEFLKTKIAFSGSGSWDELFRAGPFSKWIHVAVAQLKPSPESHILAEVMMDGMQQVDLNSDFLPCFIKGKLNPQRRLRRDPIVAIALNGVVRALSHAPGSEDYRFSAMVPESAFRSGRNEINILVQETDQQWLQVKVQQ